MKARLRDLEDGHEDVAAKLHALEERLRRLERRPQASATDPLLVGTNATKEAIEKAAWEFENTTFGQVVASYPQDIFTARKHHIQLLKANRWFNWAMIGLIVLTFLEVPAWCHGDGGAGKPWAWQPGPSRCTVPGAGDPVLSGVPYLPPGWAFVAEVLIEVVVLRKFMLEYTLEKEHFMPLEVEYHTMIATKCGCALSIGSIIDTAVFMTVRFPFRFTFIFRTGLIFLCPSVRHLFFNIFNRRVMAEFFSVAIFFMGTMVFFAFIGVTVFQHEHTVSYTAEGEVVYVNKGLETLTNSMYTMFVGGVTGEFLDCFLPSAASYHAAGLLWIFYLLLTQVLLKNLVMDTLISQYLKGAEEETDMSMKVEATGMLTAFDQLCIRDGGRMQGEVAPEDFKQFVARLRASPRWKRLPANMAALLLESAGHVTRENWCDLCLILRNEFWVTKWKAQFNLQDEPEFAWLCKMVEEPEETPDFDKLMNKVLLLNLVMVVLESTYDVMNWNEPAWMDYVELVFAFIYVGEVCIKLSVKAFAEYWSFSTNRFDFFTTWLLLATSILPYVPFAEVKADLSHYANILRLLRLLRVLKQLKKFPSVQFMVFTVSRIMSAAGEILALMGTSMFFFCNLSVNLFGGVLYEGNPKLEGTEYAENRWFFLNFNDMFAAFAMWFVQVLNEYVPSYSQALHRASAYGEFAWWIVVLFYITTAAIMYELLLAFTIDIFLAVKSEWYHEDEDEESSSSSSSSDGEEKEEKDEEDEKENKEKKEKKEKGEKEEKEQEGHHEGEEEHRHEPVTPKTPRLFFAKVQDVLEERGLSIHFRPKYDAVAPNEFEEAYEKQLEKAKFPPVEVCSSEQALCRAAWQLEDGIDGMEVARYPADIVTSRRDHLRALQATAMFNKAMVALVILTLAEVPAWCHSSAGQGGFWAWQSGAEWCVASGGGNLHLSGIPYLPPGLALIAELAIEAVVLWKYYLEHVADNAHFAPIGVEYYSRRCFVFGFIFGFGSILDTALFAIFRHPIRLTFIFRTGLLCLLPGVRRLSARIFNRKMMGEFTFVALFFIAGVLLFAWISYTIFKDMTDVAFVKQGKDVLVNNGFETLRNTIYTMFLAGITEGFVDIFAPTATVYRASLIFWFVFLVLTQVLLLNLVIDAFVSAYLEGSEEGLAVKASLRAKATLSAFSALAARDGVAPEEGCLHEHTLLEFFGELGKSPRTLPFDRSLAEAVIGQLGPVTAETFGDLCPLTQNTIWTTERDSFVKLRYPHLWDNPTFKKIRRAVWEPEETPVIDDVMNWVLVFNLLLIVGQFMHGNPLPLWMRLVDALFTAIYVCEVLTKLSVKSFREYWATPANRFDFFTTWLLFSTMVLKHLPIDFVQQDLARYANILRLMRLLRVVKKLKQYPSFQFMVATISSMMEAAGDILSLLGVVLFFFSTFSVNFLGGDLFEGNSQLAGTDYAEKYWYVFNFNDPIMAFSTWSMQLLVEYSAEMAEAVWKTSAWGEVAWTIFPIFYLVGVAILFETLKAFTIEAFLGLKERAEMMREAEAEAEGEESSSSDDGSESCLSEGVPLEESILENVRQTLADREERLHNGPTAPLAFQKKVKAQYQILCKGG